MTTNLQTLYKDIINSDLEEKFKFAFIILLETSVPENEEIVKSKINLILSE